jgi:hypothetical protein
MNVPPPLAGCEDVPPPLNARLRPSNCVEQSDTLRVDAYMFQPNEKVVYRIINPNGESVYGELTTDTDTNGDFALLFRLENYEPGHWRMEFEGADDRATVYFFVRNRNCSHLGGRNCGILTPCQRPWKKPSTSSNSCRRKMPT